MVRPRLAEWPLNHKGAPELVSHPVITAAPANFDPNAMPVLLLKRGAKVEINKDLVLTWLRDYSISGLSLKYLLDFTKDEFLNIHSMLSMEEALEGAEMVRLWMRFEK